MGSVRRTPRIASLQQTFPSSLPSKRLLPRKSG
jgi:hypothetical protein